jgi:hypothetical protein
MSKVAEASARQQKLLSAIERLAQVAVFESCVPFHLAVYTGGQYYEMPITE